jgi:hypothetical protein
MKLTKCENRHFYDADAHDVCPHCGSGTTPKVSTIDEAQHIRPTSGVFTTPPVSSAKNADSRSTTTDDYSWSDEITDTDVLTSETHENSITPDVSIIPEAEVATHPKSVTPPATPAPPPVIPTAVTSTPVTPTPVTPPIAAPAESLHSQVRAVSAHTQPEDTKTVAFYDFPSDVEPVVGWLVCVTGEYFGQSFNLKAGQNFIGRALNMDIPLAKDTKVSRNKHAIITFDPQNNIFFLQPGESSGLTYLNGELLLAPTVIDAYAQINVGDSKLIFSPFCGEQFSWKDEG